MRETLAQPPYRNRAEGGELLAGHLRSYRGRPDTIVIGLPRGGVVTAAAIADKLDLPLDVLVVRKLGTPGQTELAMGAIAAGGVRVLNDDIVRALRIGPEEIDAVAEREAAEVERRERLFRGNRPPLEIKGKTFIVADDGLATGATMSAAVAVLRRGGAAKIVIAVPVAPEDTCERLRGEADELVCLATPEPFIAVGCWYDEFEQVENDEVVSILQGVASHAH